MEKVYTLLSTGLPGVDKVLCGVRPGDNIVWQVDSVEDYIPFVHPFCRNAYAEKRKLIYFRFADHEQLLPPEVKAEVFHLHPENGFENFIDEIFNKIETFGIGACYVFDSLSELAVDWYSDRMLGNFFMLTCPYLYDFETATYFGLIKHMHTGLAINAIHRTAQVVIDVYKNRNQLYIHPLKVYKRHSDTMYMLHRWNSDGKFPPVKSSGIISEVFASAPQQWLDFSVHRFDVWTRSFSKAQEEVEAVPSNATIDQKKSSLFQKLLRMAVTRDPRLIQLAERYFDLSDLVNIGKRMIGTGLIGGKSAGMLVARTILRKSDPKWHERLSVLDSFYVGSDVYYTYLIRNNCWWVRRKCRDCEAVFDSAQEARQRLLVGTFPDDIRDQFREMLNYFGQSPIIVRSSSLLEDAYGNAFSGKYESVFCANQGTPQQRLESFMNAVRTVYASTLSREALSYRAHWGLLDKDEQMALLVQRVSGAFYGTEFYPQIAGVGFSFNPFVWNNDIKPHDGMLRLVFGLGTRAVDRIEDDYTRIVSLSAPQLRPEANSDEMRRYTQRFVDVLDLTANRHTTAEFDKIAAAAGDALPLEIFASRDEELLRRAREYKLSGVFPWVLTFEKLLSETTFPDDMRDMLATLEAAYEHPVDIEFTGNIHDDGSLRIGLVQCRPFQVRKAREQTGAQAGMVGREILKTAGPIIGNSLSVPIDRLIYIVPSIYSSLNMNERHAVARLVGRIVHGNDHLKAEPETIMLLGPGRWGTSSPSLGVPVTFAEINKVSVLCEIAVMHEGLIPDISLGTHFFNDLVEMDMLYLALYPDRAGSIFDRTFFETANNQLELLLPDASSWSNAVRVLSGTEQHIFLKVDSPKQSGSCIITET
jgi:pyruvate,water dikinase